MVNELDALLQQLAKTPNDEKVLTAVAFYYLQHPDGDKDLAFFEKAYHAKPCIETIHNYASWLSWEYGEHEQAIALQRQALALQPKSYYPYFAFAQFHLSVATPFGQPFDDKTLKILAENYATACEKFADTPSDFQTYNRLWFIEMLNNHTVTTALMGDYGKAENLFFKLYRLLDLPFEEKFNPQVKETHYKILLNHAQFFILQHDKNQAINWLIKAQKFSEACPLEIGELYAQLGDYQTAYELMKPQNFENIHESWENIRYAIYQVDKEQWRKMLITDISDLKECIKQWQNALENPDAMDEFSRSTSADLKEYIETTLFEISALQALLDSDTLDKPKTDIRQRFNYFYQCNLFGYPKGLSLASDNPHKKTPLAK